MIQFKIVSDVKKELAQWSEAADTLTAQKQIQQAHKMLDQFAQMKFEAELLEEFHRNFSWQSKVLKMQMLEESHSRCRCAQLLVNS